VKILSEKLQSSGFEVVDEELRLTWSPDGERKKICREYGRAFTQNF
jgi:anaerobic nitric oxide reductase flavorubredoxin